MMVIGVILYNKDLQKFVQLNWVFFNNEHSTILDTILASDSLTVAANKRYINEMETTTHTMKAGNTSK